MIKDSDPKTPDPETLVRLRERLNKLATVLDSRFRIPGTRIRFGWDSIVGVIPVAGDVLTALLGGYIISQAYKAGAPRKLLLRMAANTLADLFGGSVPVVGDIYDVLWRSNQRNVRLLEDWLNSQIEPRTEQEHSLVKVLVVAILLGVGGIFAWKGFSGQLRP
ncbi:DUF4112 domain-containing protein [Hahella sp. SMD15-11]|uniref:DUF4112 domain-containing protein n=1 Tax=Thermohahella caldifontis TaxID=3142973 RepID=A0AB39UWU5_9GAMM